MTEPKWTKEQLEDWCRGWSRTPQTVLHAFIDAGFCSDAEPLREETRLWPKPTDNTDSTTNAVMLRPAEPKDGKPVWYRGWECVFNEESARWGTDGWEAYLGGTDPDAARASAFTWEGLLDEIDCHYLTEKNA